MKDCTNDVCGMRRVGGQIKKGSEEVGVSLAEKRRVFRYGYREEIMICNEWYRGQRAVVKQAVTVAKTMAYRRLSELLSNDLEGNKNMFWKEVK